MTKFGRTQKVFIVAVGAFLLTCGVYALVYRGIIQVKNEMVTAHLEYDKLVAEHKQQDGMRALVEETSAIRDELAGYLLSSDDPTEFLSTVERVADEAGVALRVESLNKEEKIDKPKKGQVATDPRVTAVLFVEGSWSNMYHLLALLETMPYALSVDRVTIKEKDSNTGYRWEGQIHLSIDTAI